MNVKLRIHPQLLLLVCIGIFVVMDQRPCHGMVRGIRKAQDKDVNQALQRAQIEPEASRMIKREILTETLEKIDAPAVRPDSPIRPLKAQISQLLTKEQLSSEDITAVQENLDRIAPEVERMPERERLEFENLRENINIAQGFTEAIDELNKSHKSDVKKLNNNFDQLSGRFDYSFYGNIVLLLGVITKLGNLMNWKLDRELKRLQIDEKKTRLNKLGVNT